MFSTIHLAPAKPLWIYLFLLMASISAPCIAQTQVYTWTDASGKVHYSNSPKDKNKGNTVEIKVNSVESVSYENNNSGQTADNQVIMYATSWCGYCKKARTYFRKNNIQFTEYDIEKNSQAKRRYDQLGGRGVPVILVGKKRLNGFSAAAFENARP